MSDAGRHLHRTRLSQTAGIGRSLDIYYRDRERAARMDGMNATFVAPGARVFDIGAHVGDRTGSFLRLGASIVALEPQPRVYRALRLIYAYCLSGAGRSRISGRAYPAPGGPPRCGVLA
jgi:hypothetical protein